MHVHHLRIAEDDVVSPRVGREQKNVWLPIIVAGMVVAQIGGIRVPEERDHGLLGESASQLALGRALRTLGCGPFAMPRCELRCVVHADRVVAGLNRSCHGNVPHVRVEAGQNHTVGFGPE